MLPSQVIDVENEENKRAQLLRVMHQADSFQMQLPADLRTLYWM